MSATVAQSAKQLALRMALGADPANLRRLVLSRGLTMVAAGVVLGVAVAVQAGRLIGSLLYQVDARDPLTFSTAIVVVLVVAVAACLVPARRAMRTDPIHVLRA
jgi:ABC-type antimicrobial peptide transport system permease subunit